MNPLRVSSACGLRGALNFSGDKSIAHRAAFLAALSNQTTRLTNYPPNEDCRATLNVLEQLGVSIEVSPKKNTVSITGRGLYGLRKPRKVLHIRESGTTLRLLLGILAGQPFAVRVTAGTSLAARPMRRITLPLRMMGAKVMARRKGSGAHQEEYPPIAISGGSLQGFTYRMPVASAQVKSALMLAGLYAKGATQIIEPAASRDHTERMFKLFRAPLVKQGRRIVVRQTARLIPPQVIDIPGDISSASFFITAAALLSQSHLTVFNVGLNPTRLGVVRVLKRMGARIKIMGLSGSNRAGEPSGTIIVKSSTLKATVVNKSEIPSLIDELPILMVAACFARGRTIFKNIDELKVKEADRIRSMSENLRKMGGCITVSATGGSTTMIIKGTKHLTGSKVRSFNDHRTAMSMAIAGLAAQGVTEIDDVRCIKKSFPDFLIHLKKVCRFC